MRSKRTREEDEAEAEALRLREERMDPVSLEDLLGAKKMEQEELSKPKFLSAEDRAQMAIRKREAQMAQKRAQQEQEAQMRQEMRDNERRERDQRQRGARGSAPAAESTDDKVLQAIRSQYLGTKPKKKKVLKPSEKFKFSFDWDMNEDTSRDLNPLYQDRPESALLFGRGRRAGIDVREQQQQNEFYENLVAQRLAEQEKIRKKEKKERKRQRQAEREAAAAAGGGGDNPEADREEKSEDEDDDE